MGSNPINLTVRFFLELTALIAMGFWGWKQGEGLLRFVLALSIPIVAAVMWGVFAVPNDQVGRVTRPLRRLEFFASRWN